MVDTGDDRVETGAQEFQILADQIEAAGHGQKIDLGARVGHHDVAAGEEAQVALQRSVIDFEAVDFGGSEGRDFFGSDQIFEGTADIVARDLVLSDVVAEGLAAKALVVGVESGMGAGGRGYNFAVQGHRDQNIGHHADVGVGFLFGFPDCLKMEAIQGRQHVIHLDRRHPCIFHCIANDLRYFADAVKAAEIVGIALPALVGAAVIGVNAHDQTRDLGSADDSGRNATAFQVALHGSYLLVLRRDENAESSLFYSMIKSREFTIKTRCEDQPALWLLHPGSLFRICP